MAMRPFLFDTIYEFIAVICTLHLLLWAGSRSMDLVVDQVRADQSKPRRSIRTVPVAIFSPMPRLGMDSLCSVVPIMERAAVIQVRPPGRCAGL